MMFVFIVSQQVVIVLVASYIWKKDQGKKKSGKEKIRERKNQGKKKSGNKKIRKKTEETRQEVPSHVADPSLPGQHPLSDIIYPSLSQNVFVCNDNNCTLSSVQEWLF